MKSRKVVPLAGTWIEIEGMLAEIQIALVVPLAGTWIEISRCGAAQDYKKVVPLAGTWIEIKYNEIANETLTCRPPRGDVD